MVRLHWSAAARAAFQTGSVSPLANPGEVDFVVVREGTEGPYTCNGGALRVGTPHEVATEVSVNTAFGVERVVRDAFARAQRRPRKKLTLVHKTNVLVNAGSVWWRLFQQVAAEYPEVSTDYMHIDAAMIIMTTDPARFKRFLVDAQAAAERRYSVYQQLAGITVPAFEPKGNGASNGSPNGEEDK